MTPLDPLAWPAVVDLVRHAIALPQQEQDRLRRLAASLPPRTGRWAGERWN
ncbi:hypothetical protein [Streptomyces sp. TE12347]